MEAKAACPGAEPILTAYSMHFSESNTIQQGWRGCSAYSGQHRLMASQWGQGTAKKFRLQTGGKQPHAAPQSPRSLGLAKAQGALLPPRIDSGGEHTEVEGGASRGSLTMWGL